MTATMAKIAHRLGTITESAVHCHFDADPGNSRSTRVKWLVCIACTFDVIYTIQTRTAQWISADRSEGEAEVERQ